jgi:hypothetical protein
MSGSLKRFGLKHDTGPASFAGPPIRTNTTSSNCLLHIITIVAQICARDVLPCERSEVSTGRRCRWQARVLMARATKSPK